jgi:hypothetical protein
MKFDKNIRNVLATGIITTAFTLTLATGNVYANEHESATQTNNTTVVEKGTLIVNNTETVKAPQENTTNETTLEDSTTAHKNKAEELDSSLDKMSETKQKVETNTNDNSEETEVKTSPLLPGDFFYFLEEMTEKIQLALTFNDIEKAKLLAQFAQERITEAESLLAKGEEELAKEVLEKALEQQELAMDTYETQQKTDNKQTNGKETPEEPTVQEDSIRQQLEEKLSRNIAALQAALEKIENPKAKEALAKNIAKAKEN